MNQIQRLQKEYQVMMEMMEDDHKNISIILEDQNDLKKWKIKLLGPIGSPYEGGVFYLRIIFPDAYPLKAPQIRFLNPIYHLNISDQGQICLEILESSWTPILSMRQVLLSIMALLFDPNPNSPLQQEIKEVFENDKNQYYEMARQWTQKYAKE